MLTGLCASMARADFFRDYVIDPEDGQLDASRYLSEVPLGFLPVPTIITEPAVGFGVAAGALFFHDSDQQRKQRTQQGAMPPENISILGGADNIRSFGAGFRYLVARRYGFVMGLDIAPGPDDTAVYLQGGSTW
jgi:hypothetical protein